jgi:hypothetical protein
LLKRNWTLALMNHGKSVFHCRFDTKLLVKKGSVDPTESVKDTVYANSIKECLKEMDLFSNHQIHIGRAVGLLSAEKNELERNNDFFC